MSNNGERFDNLVDQVAQAHEDMTGQPADANQLEDIRAVVRDEINQNK